MLTIASMAFYGSHGRLATAITASSRTLPYVSVRALDRYGHCEQQQNALKASKKEGTLVVASRDPSKNITIVLSMFECSSSRSSSIMFKPSMLRITSKDPRFWAVSSRHCEKTAMICTGLKTDSNWLLRAARAYSHRVWARYNTFVDAPAVAQACSIFFRMFWGYDEEEEWTPNLLYADLKERSWGRPPGIIPMVLSSSLPFVLVVEPSGIIQRHNVFATGKYSDEILEKVARAEGVSGGVGDEDLEERLIRLIKSVVPSASRDSSILVEILSKSGIERKIVSP